MGSNPALPAELGNKKFGCEIRSFSGLLTSLKACLDLAEKHTASVKHTAFTLGPSKFDITAAASLLPLVSQASPLKSKLNL